MPINRTRTGRLRRELDDARERIAELEESFAAVSKVVQRGVKNNPSFFGLFGKSSAKASSKSAQNKKPFSVFFLPADGDSRDLIVDATSKSEALRLAKEWMRDEGENLRGATFEVEPL